MLIFSQVKGSTLWSGSTTAFVIHRKKCVDTEFPSYVLSCRIEQTCINGIILPQQVLARINTNQNDKLCGFTLSVIPIIVVKSVWHVHWISLAIYIWLWVNFPVSRTFGVTESMLYECSTWITSASWMPIFKQAVSVTIHWMLLYVKEQPPLIQLDGVL